MAHYIKPIVPANDINKLLNSYELLTVMERRKLSLVRFTFKYRNFKLFSTWFTNSAMSSQDRPRLTLPSFKKSHFKKSVRWNLIVNWNEIVNNNAVYFCHEPNYDEFVEYIKTYLCKERTSTYNKTIKI